MNAGRRSRRTPRSEISRPCSKIITISIRLQRQAQPAQQILQPSARAPKTSLIGTGRKCHSASSKWSWPPRRIIICLHTRHRCSQNTQRKKLRSRKSTKVHTSQKARLLGANALTTLIKRTLSKLHRSLANLKKVSIRANGQLFNKRAKTEKAVGQCGSRCTRVSPWSISIRASRSLLGWISPRWSPTSAPMQRFAVS